MIKREQYLKEIRPLIGKDIIKVLTGIRRCGKSTLLKQIKEELIQIFWKSILTPCTFKILLIRMI